jgi:hypothetical protein
MLDRELIYLPDFLSHKEKGKHGEARTILAYRRIDEQSFAGGWAL